MAIEHSVSARAASGRAPFPAQRPSLERSGSLARLQQLLLGEAGDEHEPRADLDGDQREHVGVQAVRAVALERREDPQGERRRSAYELTQEGEEALLAWLRSPREVPTQLRDEGLLRLFFADALSPEDQIALLARMSEIASTAATQLAEEVVPVAELAEQGGTRFLAVVARFGADLYAYSAQWLTQLREQLEEEQAEAGQAAGR
jgi:hypothetical protein